MQRSLEVSSYHECSRKYGSASRHRGTPIGSGRPRGTQCQVQTTQNASERDLPLCSGFAGLPGAFLAKLDPLQSPLIGGGTRVARQAVPLGGSTGLKDPCCPLQLQERQGLSCPYTKFRVLARRSKRSICCLNLHEGPSADFCSLAPHPRDHGRDCCTTRKAPSPTSSGPRGLFCSPSKGGGAAKALADELPPPASLFRGGAEERRGTAHLLVPVGRGSGAGGGFFQSRGSPSSNQHHCQGIL